MSNTTDSCIAHGDLNGSIGAQPVPPSIAQGFVTEIGGPMQDLGQDLQQTLQKAIDRDMVTQGDAAMEHYKVAVQHLNAAQQAVTTVAMPLEIAERHLQAFKAAVLQKELDATGSSPNPGTEGSHKGPVQRMKALLKRNKTGAMIAEAGAISSTFWVANFTRHYRERAELLESTFSGSGDEHSVMVLLEDDLKMAEASFAEASQVENGVPQLSGVGYVHRDAGTRLFKLRNSIRAIPDLQI